MQSPAANTASALAEILYASIRQNRSKQNSWSDTLCYDPGSTEQLGRTSMPLQLSSTILFQNTTRPFAMVGILRGRRRGGCSY
eukprot:3913648-Rhodomonas_salina.2